MGGRLQQLNASTGGINRQRIKGGPKPTNLYDLVNGYVDQSGAPTSRPGTVQDIVLPEGTKGLCAYDGGMVAFSHLQLTTDNPGKYTVERLTHPTDAEAALVEIHFSGPFLGYLYVAAEFDDGEVFHYWLQRRIPWTASTFYLVGAVVEPTIANGYAYRANRIGDPALSWAPDVARTVGDVVEPTTYNGYAYTVIDTAGANPRSGSVEPVWPTSDGAQVAEDTDGATPGSSGTTPTPTGNTTLPAEVEDRYGTGLAGRTTTRSAQ